VSFDIGQAEAAALVFEGKPFGVQQEEDAIGCTDHDFFPKSRADEYRADDLAVMESGKPILNRMESAPESEGSPRLVVTSKIPLRDPRGQVIGIAGFSRRVDQVRQSAGTADAFTRVIELMHEQFADPLTSEQLAEEVGLSVSQFERQFRRVMGSSPHKYLLRVRIEHAARRLKETSDSVTTIALACGFYDHAHFSRTFRRLMKVSPREYRTKMT